MIKQKPLLIIIYTFFVLLWTSFIVLNGLLNDLPFWTTSLLILSGAVCGIIGILILKRLLPLFFMDSFATEHENELITADALSLDYELDNDDVEIFKNYMYETRPFEKIWKRSRALIVTCLAGC